MNKKIIFGSIFILILISIGAYLIFATGYGGSFEVKDPVNNSNLSTKTSGGFQFYNFTCRNLSVGSFDGIALNSATPLPPTKEVDVLPSVFSKVFWKIWFSSQNFSTLFSSSGKLYAINYIFSGASMPSNHNPFFIIILKA